MIGPTSRQFQVLRAIDSSIRERGYPPTMRELCEALGISSTTGIRDHLYALVRKGLVRTCEKQQARSLTITAAGRALLPPQPAPEALPYAAEQAIEALDLSA